MQVPPPLPTQTESSSAIWSQDELSAYLDKPLMAGNRIFPGTEGLLLRDLEQDILKGGRFVVHHYCISVFIMTFTRSSSIHYLRSTQSGLSRAASYTLLSMTLGWWGIPYGFIMTPFTFWKNGRGGTDVTADHLPQVIGSTRAHSILSKAAPRRISGLHGLLLSLSLGLPPLMIYTLFKSLDNA